MKKNSDSHYLILGANSKTGKALAQYMSNHKFQYSLSDISPQFFTTNYAKELSLSTPPTQVFDNPEQTFEQLNTIDHIVLSPGVPMSHPLLKEARRRSIPVDGEIAFCYHILQEDKHLPFFVGITGSLGKSTTSCLVYELLRKGLPEKNIYLLGNFGTPLATHLDTLKEEDIVILELSSYQLEDAQNYRVNIATVLNVTPNHLDRYHSLEDYQKAKEKIFECQTPQDFSIFNKSRKELSNIPAHVSSQHIFINSSYDATCSYSYDSRGNIYERDTLFLENSALRLQSPHIVENMCAALALTSIFSLPASTQKEVLSSFKGLEHRSEWVGDFQNIRFINDSKATTPFAVIPNLQDPSHGSIVLILGGKNKDLDFSILAPHLQNIRAIVYYGKDGESIQKMLPFTPSVYVYDFSEAVTEAYHMAGTTHARTVLLSPGCTSFDQFSSYEQRGLAFKELIRTLQRPL